LADFVWVVNTINRDFGLYTVEKNGTLLMRLVGRNGVDNSYVNSTWDIMILIRTRYVQILRLVAQLR